MIKKALKTLLVLVLIIAVVSGSLLLIEGYQLYRFSVGEVELSQKIQEIQSNANYTSLDNISQDFLNALISIEDRRFYEHHGINPVSIGRAIIINLKNWSFKEGGSTITQQLAKNMYYTQEKKLARKVAELLVAFQLEHNCSKDTILELYVNIVYFGDGYYGIKAASEGYFHVSPAELTFDQATLLAGLPNAPSAYALKKHMDKALIRQKQVIRSMVVNGYITEEEAVAVIG